MESAVRILITTLLIIACAGCTSTPNARADHHILASNDADFIVHWSTRPNTIPINDFFEVDVQLLDRKGAPLTKAILDVDAAMPQHRHGMNHRSHMESLGDGRWRAEDMLFHMPGDWVLYFDVEQHGIVRRAQVDVEVD